MNKEKIKIIKGIVKEQTDNDALWFDAQYATEAYLQQELRRLHEAIEGKSSKECAIKIINNQLTNQST